MSRSGDRAFRAAVIVPSALLVAIALLQIGLARGAALSPWKGGGFGMFASTDGGLQRSLRLFAIAPERSEELTIPSSLRTEAARATMYPSERRLARLARLVADREERAGRPIAAVRIEVWKTSFGETSLEPRAELLSESRIETSDDGR